MKKFFSLLFFLSTAIAIFTSCCKEDPSATYIKFQNISEYPFDVWVDGEYKTTVAGGTFSDQFSVSPGVRDIKIEQQSGYFYYPLKGEQTITCTEGIINIFKFPLSTNGQITIQNNSNSNYAIFIDGGVQKISQLYSHSSQTIDVDGWRQHTVVWYLNDIPIGNTVVQVDAGYVYTVQISS